MSVRNLGDWSPLDLSSDPIHADMDKIREAQRRYKHISQEIDDAVARLKKIVDTDSESLAGQYVEGLRQDANKVYDGLSKTAVRYADVAGEIAKYEPDLQHGLDETAGALEDARAAKDAKTRAGNMPRGQKDEDGKLSPEEQQKNVSRDRAEDAAEADYQRAKNRLMTAMDDLNAAGTRFGDAINEKKYNDGLSDSSKDKLNAVLKVVSKVLAIVGMVLAVLTLLIPGVNVLVLAGVAVAAASLVVNIILFKAGEGSVVHVIMGAVGLGLAGFGAGMTQLAKNLAAGAKNLAAATKSAAGFKVAPRLEFRPGALGEKIPLRPLPGGGGGQASNQGGQNVGTVTQLKFNPVDNKATEWTTKSDWFNNPVTNWLIGKGGGAKPELGYWKSFVEQFKDVGKMYGSGWGKPAENLKEWAATFGGVAGPMHAAHALNAVGGKLAPAHFIFGGVNGVFKVGAMIYTGGMLQKWIPPVPLRDPDNEPL
jgi:hypothetical protein